MNPEVIHAQEHKPLSLTDDIKQLIASALESSTGDQSQSSAGEAEGVKKDTEDKREPLSSIRYLGIRRDGAEYKANYYVGLDWLKEGELALCVRPKMESIDYQRMFMACLNNTHAAKHIKSIYHIYEKKKPITISQQRFFDLTPFLVLHFLQVLQSIVRRGLKRGFVYTRENLNAKIKGKLLFGAHLKRNIVTGRQERNFCSYQEHTVNCIENQVLKKALRFVTRYMLSHGKGLVVHDETRRTISQCQAAFSGVGDTLNIAQVKQHKINPLYREYAQAIRLAHLIFKRFDYTITNTDADNPTKFLPHIIDMPILFQLYTYTKLDHIVEYEKQHGDSRPDFLYANGEQKMILDTKYKHNPLDAEKNDGRSKVSKEDCRQLADYARNKLILKALNVPDETIVDCVIIYPLNPSASNATENGSKINNDDKINFDNKIALGGFVKFYKIGVRLPQKHSAA